MRSIKNNVLVGKIYYSDTNSQSKKIQVNLEKTIDFRVFDHGVSKGKEEQLSKIIVVQQQVFLTRES